jgi:potassium efflux system protein
MRARMIPWGVLDSVLEYLREPWVVLSGTAVTPLAILTAVGIVIASRVLAAMLARSVARILRARGADDGVEFAVGKIIRYGITIVGVFVAVSTIGVNMSAVVAAATVLLVGIGFGLQKMAENFISGLILLVERPVRKGDFIEVAGVLGTVEDIGLRATTVVSRDHVTVIVPNGELVSGTVINHSVPDTTLRIWVRVGVAYGTDLEQARALLLDVAKADARVQAKPSPEVRHEGFGDSAMNLALVCWIGQARDDMLAMSDLRFAIDRAFRGAGIVIPVPQREVRIKEAGAS